MENIYKLSEELLIASEKGDTKCVEKLISKGANVNIRESYGGFRTPLHRASFNGHLETALYLISKGADINCKSIRGDTPLHDASHRGKTEIVLALISKGANINSKNDDGKTSVFLAQRGLQIETMVTLISFGADTSTLKGDHFKNMTMHQAAAQGGLTSRVIELLRDHPSGLRKDSPKLLMARSQKHGKHNTAAAIQSFMASQAIEKMMSDNRMVSASCK